MQNSPSILLLGGGHVLQKIADNLAPGSFVITSRREQQVDQWKATGILSERVDTLNPKSLEPVLKSYPSIQTVIDSVPPIFSKDTSTTTGIENTLRVFNQYGGIERILYLSTTGVYGVTDGSWVDEKSPTNPENHRSEARLESEECYRRSGYSVTSFRISAIYGPRRGIVESLRSGKYPYVEDGTRWSNRIHVKDLSAILTKALTSSSLPEVLCLSDEEPALTKDVVQFLVERLNVPFPPSLSLEEVRARGMTSLLSNQRVNSRLVREVLGYAFRFPTYREGGMDCI